MSELCSDSSNKCNNSDQSDFGVYSQTQFSSGGSSRKLGLALGKQHRLRIETRVLIYKVHNFMTGAINDKIFASVTKHERRI